MRVLCSSEPRRSGTTVRRDGNGQTQTSDRQADEPLGVIDGKELPTAPSHPFYRRLKSSRRAAATTVHHPETLEIRTYISEPDRGRHWMRTPSASGDAA